MTGVLWIKPDVFWTAELDAEFLVWKLSEQVSAGYPIWLIQYEETLKHVPRPQDG